MVRTDNKKYVLTEDPEGSHLFGGKPFHSGIVPKLGNLAAHLLFQVDTRDCFSPISHSKLRYIPLYHPLKYGSGGGEMQYRVVADNEIEIIYISEDEDDGEDSYVQVSKFPEKRFKIARAVEDEDSLYFTDLTIGGELDDHEKRGCLNSKCKSYGKSDHCDLIASIPPVPCESDNEIWYEFEGAYVFFQFCYCRSCDSILTYNTCT